MPYNMLVLITLTLMQGHTHSGLAKAKNQHCMLSATKQAISIKLAATIGHLLHDLDLDFANMYMACPACLLLFFWSMKICFQVMKGLLQYKHKLYLSLNLSIKQYLSESKRLKTKQEIRQSKRAGGRSSLIFGHGPSLGEFYSLTYKSGYTHIYIYIHMLHYIQRERGEKEKEKKDSKQ